MSRGQAARPGWVWMAAWALGLVAACGSGGGDVDHPATLDAMVREARDVGLAKSPAGRPSLATRGAVSPPPDGTMDCTQHPVSKKAGPAQT